MKPIIQYEDFEKIELRVGKVIEASAPDWSKKLLQFTVDFGPEIGTKTIFSGVRQWYTPEDFLNKKFPFVINLAEKKMGDSMSQGMQLMADAQINGEMQAVALPLPDEIESGTLLR